MTKAILIGSGGHAKVVIDILRETSEIEPVGCISLAPVGELVNGLTVLGGDDLLPELRKKNVTHAFAALGDNRLRLQMLEYLLLMRFELLNAISRYSVISSSVKVGIGTAIMPGVIINADTRIADGVIINTGSTVDHDCEIGKACHIGPGTNLAGGVKVEQGAFLGTGSRVIPRMSIGAWSVVGAGAVVISEVPANSVFVGVPARVLHRP